MSGCRTDAHCVVVLGGGGTRLFQCQISPPFCSAWLPHAFTCFSHLRSLPACLACLLPQVGSIEDLEVYYERLGTFTGLYARHIFNRMAKTVPKAIILCQVCVDGGWGGRGRG